MKRLVRLATRALGCLMPVACCLHVHSASAQTDPAAGWPKQPVKLVVGLAPGSINDIQSRVIAAKLAERLGQPVVVENKVGAGGNIAAEFVARAAGDGYTLLTGPTSTITVNPAVYSKLPYDPQRDFVPVTQISTYQLYLTVSGELPVKTVADLIQHAKANPAKANLGSPSTVFELVTAMFMQRTGTKFETIPFKGTNETMSALLTNQIMIAWQDFNSVNQHIRAGKARALATSGRKRSTDMPDVPTMAEVGLAGIDLEPLTGIFAPKATPMPIVRKLQTEIQAVLKAPDVVERWKSITMTPVGNTSEEFGAYIASEIKRWTEVAKAANIKLE